MPTTSVPLPIVTPQDLILGVTLLAPVLVVLLTAIVVLIIDLVITDLALQALVVVVGLAVFFHADLLVDPVHLGTSPQWKDVLGFRGADDLERSAHAQLRSDRVHVAGVARATLFRLGEQSPDL